ncbi:hypothetical protein AMECASPLE_013530 [Ameca splendens]|uniref:Uncharacterized protein n=1 Tax=Ameca splendens TaxID=208324 RepID=A0ABV0YP20_9TELE
MSLSLAALLRRKVLFHVIIQEHKIEARDVARYGRAGVPPWKNGAGDRQTDRCGCHSNGGAVPEEFVVRPRTRPRRPELSVKWWRKKRRKVVEQVSNQISSEYSD